MELHDLTAAYALDALDADEARAYERHLPTCDRCRDELAALQEGATALALAAPAAAPPAALRERVLEAARGERSNVVPLRRNRPFAFALAGATAAAAASVLLALWGLSNQDRLNDEQTRSARLASVVANARLQSPMEGANGTLVVSRTGEAALVLDRLPAIPTGKRYHAWVIEGGMPSPAGLFDDEGVVFLDRPVPPGAVVALTPEDGPVSRPTAEPVASARA